MSLALLYALPASAVNDSNTMQMDGDAQTAVQSNPTAPEDWDLICKANPTTCTFKDGYSQPSGSTTATASSHVADGTGASIFTTGGSKDPLDVSSWRWKDGSVPDKDNLLHAFAARYEKPIDATHCPAAAGQTSCSLLFFGSDRFDNSGDAQQGFWFFQKKVSLNADGTFSGVHTNGDVLIVSDFSNGGVVSIINVYKWLNGNLTFLAGGDNSKCTAALSSGSPLCGIVNSGPSQIAPWLYTDKSGNANYAANEFYEAGINLSAPSINLGGECFSSFVAETRSSTSTTATLKDFVLGQFAVCEAGLTTSPSVGAGGVVLPGVSVTDLATVQGSGSATPPTPTGSITFHLCGPIATGVCTTGGTLVSTNALANSAPPAGEAQATSDAVNTSASPLAPGRYCFRADWPGDSNYSGPFSHTGTNDSECFVVRQIPTSTVTTPSDSSGTALTSPVALGTSMFDKAVVTGTSVGGTPAGTVSFAYCDPDHVSGASGSEVCAAADSTAIGSARTLVADSGSNPPSSSVLSSPGVTASKAGVWCFRATYSPSGSTYIGSSDASHTECVTVGKDSTTTVTTPQVSGSPISGAVAVNTSVTDHAVVTGTTGGGSPTGTIDFFVCNPTQVAANGGTCSTGGTAAGSKTAAAIAGSSPPKTQADSDAITASSVGTWCFRAVYTPGGTNGGNYTGSSDSTTGECFLVQDSTSVSSAQDWLPNDTATVAATGGTALNGTLKFELFESTDCSGTPVTGQTYTRTLTNATSAADRTKSTANTTYLVTANKSVSWKVTFTPDAGSNVTGSSHCETTSLTITN